MLYYTLKNGKLILFRDDETKGRENFVQTLKFFRKNVLFRRIKTHTTIKAEYILRTIVLIGYNF